MDKENNASQSRCAGENYFIEVQQRNSLNLEFLYGLSDLYN